MVVEARAPGKMAVLGEYAVLAGAPALVLAVDRRCRASLAPRGGRPDGPSRLETRFPEPARVDVPPGADSGVALVDLVRAEVGCNVPAPWSARLDSSEFFAAGRKLGLGSSAAALCAFAGAWALWSGAARPTLGALIELHRRFQGGAGSGLDVAASVTGGAIVFESSDRGEHRVSSVRMPKGVGFAGIFAGRSASTPDLLARYHSWWADEPAEAAAVQSAMQGIAQAGCAAAREGESEAFLRAVEQYGNELDRLGRAIGADIVTPEHREVGALARRFGVTYKVSGAGGGDLGVALADDPDALEAFKRAAAGRGCDVVELDLDRRGLVVEERTE